MKSPLRNRFVSRAAPSSSGTGILTALLFIVLAWAVSGCENDERKIQDWSKNVVMKEEATKVESYLSQDGRLRAKLLAPLMYRVAADTVYTEFPQTLHVDFYNDSTLRESWLDSRYGKYYDNLNKVYLKDSVVVINTKGDTLKCQDLWWDQNTRLFYSDKYAEYRTLDKKIYPGKGLEATQDFSRVTFREVTGVLQVKESGFPQ